MLLLFDFWPFERKENWKRLLTEKIPFAVLSAISCYVTIRAQSAGGAIHHFADYPPLIRFANIAQAYWDYLILFFWPAKLSIFYPYIPNAHVTRSLAIGLVLMLFTAVLFFRRKQVPALWTGWCLFGIMVFPVVGVITIGAHWIACRYLYGPAIGLSIMLLWGGEAALSKIRFPKNGIRLLAAGILGCYLAVASTYLAYWQNSYKLFWHAVDTVPHNWVAHVNLRAAYGRDSDHQKAAEHLIEAIKIFPDITNRIPMHWLDFYYMGQVNWEKGQVQQAESYLRESARRLAQEKPENLVPINLPQRNNLAACLAAFDSNLPDNCKL